jgi:hypothetical protein
LLTADAHRDAVAPLGVGATVLIMIGIGLPSSVAIWAGVASLGLAGTIARAPAPPLCALALFVVSEAALWSTEDRVRVAEDANIRRDRLLVLTGVAAASVALGAGIRLVAEDAGDRQTSYTVIAAISITALAALIVATARLPSAHRSHAASETAE